MQVRLDELEKKVKVRDRFLRTCKLLSLMSSNREQPRRPFLGGQDIGSN